MGNMGRTHARNAMLCPEIELVAVCEANQIQPGQLERDGIKAVVYNDYHKALAESGAEAVLIATPHTSHPEIALEAFSRGLHVLVEKPLAIHALDARRMVKAWEEAKMTRPGLVFAAMFQQRTQGHWQKIKSLLEDGELGRLVRTTWIITDWFRTQHYYDSGNWRATWAGEGGGVLLNQCPHNLDLYNWLVGLPRTVHGHCSLGKYHDIEVEDEVSAYFEHENGMVGHFITSTAEAPGTNRLEIVGENGKLVCEQGSLVFHRNRKSMLGWLKDSDECFSGPECWKIDLPYAVKPEPGHRLMLENFAAAILRGEPLLAPATDGVPAVLLGNAILYSSQKNMPIALPMDEQAYADMLAELAAHSRYSETSAAINPEMKPAQKPALDFSKSFQTGK
jgi:predicted dehydrogenase